MTTTLDNNQKGIWVRRSPECGICYETSLRRWKDGVVEFIEFDHPYEPRYLGSIAFRDLEKLAQPMHCVKINRGLVQNHFYPIGGDPITLRPLLIGKGLPKRIELAVARDLLDLFAPDMPVIIAANSDTHLEYCKRVGIVPFNPIPLEEYFKILNKPHRPQSNF